MSNVPFAWKTLVSRIALLPLAAMFGAASSDLPTVIGQYETFTTAYAMEAGRSDPSYAPDGWPDDTPTGMAGRRAELVRMRSQLDALDLEALQGEDPVNRDFLRATLGWRIEGIDFDERRFAFVAKNARRAEGGHRDDESFAVYAGESRRSSDARPKFVLADCFGWHSVGAIERYSIDQCSAGASDLGAGL